MISEMMQSIARTWSRTLTCRAAHIDARSELVAVTFFFTLTFSGLDTHLFVVFLKRCKIFASFGELTLLHTLTNIPVNKGTLGVHQVELVVDAGEDFSNGSGVTDHTASSHDPM